LNPAVPENRAAIATANLGDALLLILALCFHSVFEGIAIGVAGKSIISRNHGIVSSSSQVVFVLFCFVLFCLLLLLWWIWR
jgi:hypothetical protein